MNIKSVKTNNVIVEVTPRNEGNYGFFSISGQQRTPDAEYRLAKQIESDIKRQIDDVEYINIKQETVYQDQEGEEFDTLFELLSSNLEHDDTYIYRYVRPSDGDVGTRARTNDFRELIEVAFKNPHQFEVIDGELLDSQKEFLNSVISLGKVTSITY